MKTSLEFPFSRSYWGCAGMWYYNLNSFINKPYHESPQFHFYGGIVNRTREKKLLRLFYDPKGEDDQKSSMMLHGFQENSRLWCRQVKLNNNKTHYWQFLQGSLVFWRRATRFGRGNRYRETVNITTVELKYSLNLNSRISSGFLHIIYLNKVHCVKERGSKSWGNWFEKHNSSKV